MPAEQPTILATSAGFCADHDAHPLDQDVVRVNGGSDSERLESRYLG